MYDFGEKFEIPDFEDDVANALGGEVTQHGLTLGLKYDAFRMLVGLPVLP